MSDITKGRTWASGETITPERQNAMLDDAVIAAGAVTTAKIADDAVTSAKIAAGAVITECIEDGACTGPKLGAGALLQVVASEYTGYQNTSAVIPQDNTVPLISEGTELLTATITPAGASNKIAVRFSGSANSNTAGVAIVFALFSGSTCLAAKVVATANNYQCADVTFDVVDAPATTSPVVYSVRFGAQSGYATYVGGSYGSGQLFNGKNIQTLTLMEIKG